MGEEIVGLDKVKILWKSWVTVQTQKQQTRLKSAHEQLNSMEEQIAGLDSNKDSLREVCD
jgi:hypothetical protein